MNGDGPVRDTKVYVWPKLILLVVATRRARAKAFVGRVVIQGTLPEGGGGIDWNDEELTQMTDISVCGRRWRTACVQLFETRFSS